MFRGRFIFASGLLPDRDCIFWENVLADERRAVEARLGVEVQAVAERGWGPSLGRVVWAVQGLLRESSPWRSPLSLQGMGPALLHP